MLTVTNLLMQNDLGPGDVVYIDTGVYSNYTITFLALNSGTIDNPIVVQGSTNSAMGGTVIDRGGSVEGLAFLGGNACYLKNLIIRNASPCVRIGKFGTARSDDITFEGVVMESLSGATDGVLIDYNGGKNSVFRRSVVRGGRRGIGAYGGASSGHVVDGCVLLNCESSIFGAALFAVSNSIMTGGLTAFESSPFVGNIPRSGDYNVFWNIGLGNGSEWATLSDFQQSKQMFWQSIVGHPMFVDEGGGDFHPKSVMGRYDSDAVQWMTDAVHSVVIDCGDRGRLWGMSRLQMAGL